MARMLTIVIETYAELVRQPAAQAVAWALLQFVWQGAAIGAVAAIALAVLRRSAPDVRYVIASIGMALMLTLPVVTGVQKYQTMRATQDATLRSFRHQPQGSFRLKPEATMSGPEATTPGPEATTPGPEATTPGPEATTPGMAPAPSALASTPPPTAAPKFLPALMLVWLAGVLALTLRLVGGWFWMHRMRTHGVRPAEPAWERMLERLARQLHVTRTVTLVESARVDVPTVIGWLKPVVLLPVSAIAQLSSAQLEAILAHELAHIRRHDYLVNLLQTLVETLLFYHPAVWWISRRIRIERENCCDDLAVSLCGDPVAYAQALADLETLRSSIPPFRRLDRTALAATGGSLLQRIRRLLGAPAAHSGVGPVWLAASAAVLIVAGMTVGANGVQASHVTVAAATPPTVDGQPAVAARPPSVPSAPSAPAPSASAPSTPAPSAPAPAAPSAPTAPTTAAAQSLSQSSSSSHGNWTWSHNGDKLQVDYDGSLDFTDDDTDVRQMSPGGSLKISDGAWLGRHSVEITERGGRLEHRYFVNGVERPFEPEGRAWLQQNLPRFVRNTGIAAPSRVARLLKSGGVSAVLSEIGRVDGSYVRGIYYRELFKQATLTPEQYRQVLTQAGSEMKGSNYELSQLLIALADRLPNDETSRAAYFAAASNLTGAYETGRVYSTMLKKGNASPQIVTGILDHLRTLHSDYEVSQLLMDVIRQQPLDARNAASVLDVAAGMQGDYERGRVLTAFLKQNGIEGNLRASFFRAVDSVRGAYERSQILLAVVGRSDASRDTLKQAIQATRPMGAYETSQVLLAVAKAQPVTGDLRDAYIDAADRLGAYEQGQVMTALVRSERRR